MKTQSAPARCSSASVARVATSRLSIWACYLVAVSSLFGQTTLLPYSGSYQAGQPVSFTMTGYSSDNWSSSNDYLIFETVRQGDGWSGTQFMCQLEYQPVTQTAYVNSDSGGWTSGVLGSSTVLSNSKCSIDLSGGSASNNAGTLTVSFPVTYPSGYVGTKDLYVAEFLGAWYPYYEGTISVVSASQVATPTLSPGGGDYTMPLTMSISTTTTGASIRYTLDDTTPTETAGTLYTGPFSISNVAQTVKAIAYKTGYTDSALTSADYYAPVQTLPNDLYLTGASLATGSYAANYTVNTSGSVTLASAGSATFLAGSQVNLEPGFHATSGSTFDAKISAPDYIINVVPAAGYNGDVAAGGTTDYTITVTSVFGFTGTVQFAVNSVTGLPANATAAFNSYTVSPPTNGSASIPVHITTSSASPFGSFTLGISGTSGSLAHSANFQLTIGSAAGLDFSITATPQTQTVNETGNVTYAIQISPINGFNSTVFLSASGLPSGASNTITPNTSSAPYSGSSSFTVTTSGAQAGTYYLTVTGTTGSLTHSTVVALNVTATLFQITTVPSGRSFTADGIGYSAPQGFPWAPNSQHTIAITTSPQPGGTGTQYAYSSWSDAGAQSHTVTAGSSPATYTANFSTQYYLTTVASPPADGSISPASNWYNAGSVVSVTATPNAGSTFSGFSGALTGTTTPQNVTMSSPASVTANFGTTTYTISGTILGASGGPLANITVKLNGGSSSVQTDGNGQYSFPSLAPGNYTVSPSSMSHSFCPATTTFALSGSQTANFNADGPAREYIRLGSRVIAIANCGSP